MLPYSLKEIFRRAVQIFAQQRDYAGIHAPSCIEIRKDRRHGIAIWAERGGKSSSRGLFRAPLCDKVLSRMKYSVNTSALFQASHLLSLCGLLLLALDVFAGDPDIRRDATVTAVERVMPSVVNIA